MKKKQTTYSFFSNMKYLFSNMWSTQKRLTLTIFLRVPFVVLLPYLGIYLSKEVVNGVTQQVSVERLLTTIGLISLGIILCSICEKCLTAELNTFLQMNDLHWQLIMFDKTISMDYENMEKPEGLTRLAKAMSHCGGDSTTTRKVAKVVSTLLANLLGVVSYAGMLILLSPWIMLVVGVTAIAGFFLRKLIGRWNYKNRDNWMGADRKINYLKENSGDYRRAKDMRLYQMTHWFMDVFADTLAERMEWHRKEQLFGLKVDFGSALLAFVREGVTYGFLVFLIFGSGMDVADFVLYFGLIGGFATWLTGLAADMETMHQVHLGICEIREFVDMPDLQNHGKGCALPKDTFSIEFCNVSYRYAGSDKDVIHDLSFRIEKGEKVAIVGLNGAGKTTLVKLMCGLYTPTSGTILIDGKPVSAYNIEEYYSLFSAVFQEIYLLPVSIARNISAATKEQTDEERVIAALKLAGLYEKIASLPKGIHTRLVKSVYDDAVELSGGEMQKLALARALYKNGKALILDEPTAALDPIAESRIYSEYERMTQNHTSVFISHRLASTRFCDRIFFLETGRIAEAGTHQELMELGGRYAEMFEIQSQYYREDVSV